MTSFRAVWFEYCALEDDWVDTCMKAAIRMQWLEFEWAGEYRQLRHDERVFVATLHLHHAFLAQIPK